MPGIRLVVKDDKAGTQEEIWYRLTEYQIDKEGYLQFFRLHWNEDYSEDLYLFRRDLKLLDLARAIFDAATTLMSAKKLLADWNKLAAKEPGNLAIGVTGIVLSSADLIAKFLQTQPFHHEGYYNGSGKLVLARKIHSKTKQDYDPRNL